MSDSNRSILIVEDELAWREMYDDMLASTYKLTYAKTLSQAEGLLDSVKFDLVIVDPSLDPEDHAKLEGIKVVKRIATLDAPIPVIVITGDYSRVRGDDPLISGLVYRVLEKTASYEELNEAVETALGKNRAENNWLNVSWQTTETLSTYKMLKVLLEMLQQLTSTDVIHVLMPTKQKNELVIVADTGQDEGRYLNLIYSITGRAFRTRTTIYVPDTGNEAHYQSVRGMERMYSELAIPIQHEDVIYGVLNLESNRLSAFDVRVIELAEIFATIVPLLMKNQNYQSIVRELHLIAGEMLKSALDLDSVWKLILDRGLHLLNADQGFLAERQSDNSGLLQIKAATLDGLTGQILDKRDHVAYEVVNSGIGKRIENMPYNQRMHKEQSVIAVPVRVNDSAGILKFESEEPGTFDYEHERLVLILANYISIAVNRASQAGMKRQTALATTFAHRIGNPIYNIREALQGISSDELTVIDEQFPNLAVALQNAKKNVGKAINVIEALKQNLARIETKPVDIMAVAIAAAEDKLKTRTNIHLNLENLTDIPKVLADDNLQNVFADLFENAAEHITDEGQITVEGRIVDRVVEISVTDTGTGIPTKFRPYIFSPGFTLKPNATPTDGLGLSFCKQYIESCGGKIELGGERDELNSGTVIIFTLPAHVDMR